MKVQLMVGKLVKHLADNKPYIAVCLTPLPDARGHNFSALVRPGRGATLEEAKRAVLQLVEAQLASTRHWEFEGKTTIVEVDSAEVSPTK